MNGVSQQLQKSLYKGFISKQIESDKELLPEFLSNDESINKKVLTTLLHQLKNCDEFWFSVAFITTSGVATLMNALTELEEKNIKGKIVVSNYLNFTQPLALQRLLDNFENIDLRIIEKGNFHAKGYLFKKKSLYNLIVGSSNLTSNALCVNKEWNLKISAEENSYIIHKALNEFQKEFENATIVTSNWIREYSSKYDFVKQSNSRNVDFSHSSNKIEPNLMQFWACIMIRF